MTDCIVYTSSLSLAGPFSSIVCWPGPLAPVPVCSQALLSPSAGCPDLSVLGQEDVTNYLFLLFRCNKNEFFCLFQKQRMRPDRNLQSKRLIGRESSSKVMSLIGRQINIYILSKIKIVFVSKPVLRSSQFPASLFDASICSPDTPAPAQECAQAEPSLVEAGRQNERYHFSPLKTRFW